MEKVPGKGVVGGSQVVVESVYLETNPSCAPDNWGMEGSTVEDGIGMQITPLDLRILASLILVQVHNS